MIPKFSVRSHIIDKTLLASEKSKSFTDCRTASKQQTCVTTKEIAIAAQYFLNILAQLKTPRETSRNNPRVIKRRTPKRPQKRIYESLVNEIVLKSDDDSIFDTKNPSISISSNVIAKNKQILCIIVSFIMSFSVRLDGFLSGEKRYE